MTIKKEIKKLAKAMRKKANVEFVQSFRIAKLFIKNEIYYMDWDKVPLEVDDDSYIYEDKIHEEIELCHRFSINGVPLEEIWDW